MENLDLSKLPKHIAIIMDGNGRWAQEQGQDRLFGHYQGVISVRKVVEAATEIGIEYLTLYAFSTENWERPEQEVTGLMTLFVDTIAKEVPDLHKNNIRLHFIGNLDLLPDEARQALATSTATTAQNTGLQLVIALSYSSRWEIIEAAKTLATQAKAGQVDPTQINEAQFVQALSTKDFPDPELMIRTSGEHRISNFLLWQAAYAEFWFTETLWPDFDQQVFSEAIAAFVNRERRFGCTGEQIRQLATLGKG